MADRIVEIVLKITGNEKLAGLSGGLVKVGRAGVTAAKQLSLVAGAITAMVLASAKSQKELKILARQARLTVQEFQALAFATEQYGINAEQIADISKDLSDRLGEFATVGTGTFMDFADVVGLSKDEAMDLATELQSLSGPEVIGRLVKDMEAVNATGNQMTFVLESMGNDLSRLLPLFVDGAKELNTLEKAFDTATKSFELSAGELQKLSDAGVAFTLTTASLKGASASISAVIAPAITGFFEDLIEIIPRVTEDLKDLLFFFGFTDVTDFLNIADIDRQIIDLKASILDTRIALQSGPSFPTMSALQKRLRDDIFELERFQAQKRKIEADELKAKEDENDATNDLNASQANLQIAELQKAADRELLILLELNESKRKIRDGESTAAIEASKIQETAELATLTARQEELEEGQLRFGDSVKLAQDLENQKTIIAAAGSAERKALAEAEAQAVTIAHLKGAASFLSGLAQVNEKSKGLKRASIVANTAVAVMETLAIGGFWAIPLAAITAAIGVQQFAQVGKNDGVKGVGGGGGGALSSASSAASAGLNGPSLTEETQINQIQSSELSALQQELANLDPDDVLPVSFVRRLTNSLTILQSEGTI